MALACKYFLDHISKKVCICSLFKLESVNILEKYDYLSYQEFWTKKFLEPLRITDESSRYISSVQNKSKEIQKTMVYPQQVPLYHFNPIMIINKFHECIIHLGCWFIISKSNVNKSVALLSAISITTMKN